jgi:hypothetical protein
MSLLIIFIFLAVLISFLLVYFLILKKRKKTPKNELLEKRSEIVKSWKNLLNSLKKRDETIATLVDSLENVDLKEKNVLADLLRMRSEFKYADNFTSFMMVNDKVNDTLQKSFLILEKYQDVLKDNQKYQKATEEINQADVLVREAIAKYNNIVVQYNNIIDNEKHKELAKKLGYTKKEIFSVEE